MRLLLVAGLLVSAAVQAQTAQWIQCPLNGISYALMPPTTWQQAEQSAITAGGHLATVRDANIQAWLVQTFASAAAPDTRIWIGLSDAVTEGTWTWASGEPLSGPTRVHG